VIDPSTTDIETLDHAALAAFAARLSAYASELSQQDRLALSTLLLRAMDPLERMRWRDAAQLLSPGEEAVLLQLLEQPATS
jgi:hypothetical protein